MKHFAQCDHCQQWYTPAVILTVQVQQGMATSRTTIWCYRCIAEVEQRSAALRQTLTMPVEGEEARDRPEDSNSASFFARESLAGITLPVTTSQEASDVFQQCIQEHLALMERALHEDDAILGVTVTTFLQQCRSLLEHTALPEQRQRLQGCVHYWETFLRALNQGSC